MRKVILFFILISTVIGAWADNITFTANAPEVVVSGDQFRLSYTINSQKVRDFRAPSIKEFEVLMGPSRSTQSSTQIINGNVTSTSTITFTYILMAGKEGTYKIPGATIVADGNNPNIFYWNRTCYFLLNGVWKITFFHFRKLYYQLLVL